ncbi:urease accessory protein UreF [Roseobacter weihaiensis]|uniref:urease accessory protein UreF n=1 Tax=Roseobacter weihaiensis TaxID=2763262 RepID=UPI001D0A6E50|nr:urease accessory protein UreF [Roseobacter sp. H9]
MNTDAFLTLTQWLSPGFPVGAFAYSHGLEHVIDTGEIRDARTLKTWLEDILRHGSARNDVILLTAAYNAAPQQVDEIDAIARAFASSHERQVETVDQGAAFARTVDAIWGTDVGALCYPVAVGRAARAEALPLPQTAEIYTHAFVANLVSAAVRLVPLGQTEGQTLLAQCAPLIRAVAELGRTAQLEDLASCCFATDIAAMRHETQYAKVFRT